MPSPALRSASAIELVEGCDEAGVLMLRGAAGMVSEAMGIITPRRLPRHVV
ncbi:hypothetical protein IM697_24610 [Streptomyces ferrugineus]|uniref:Uncharacterized protein n=1 Tax=Streptomyces ferrugineus TaxID=1413221 RepID=A0A7M2SAJ5_9ACTN|nr:hypothetical protein [Streptomyces ferrugineus]QOV33397.1 hypothetical protein IM697_24610 [Streptomyces ferrugineus]